MRKRVRFKAFSFPKSCSDQQPRRLPPALRHGPLLCRSPAESPRARATMLLPMLPLISLLPHRLPGADHLCLLNGAPGEQVGPSHILSIQDQLLLHLGCRSKAGKCDNRKHECRACCHVLHNVVCKCISPSRVTARSDTNTHPPSIWPG